MFHSISLKDLEVTLINSKFPSPVRARAGRIWNCYTKSSKNKLKRITKITLIEDKAGLVSPLIVAYAFENQAMYVNVHIQFPIIKNFVQRS